MKPNILFMHYFLIFSFLFACLSGFLFFNNYEQFWLACLASILLLAVFITAIIPSYSTSREIMCECIKKKIFNRVEKFLLKSDKKENYLFVKEITLHPDIEVLKHFIHNEKLDFSAFKEEIFFKLPFEKQKIILSKEYNKNEYLKDCDNVKINKIINQINIENNVKNFN